MFLEELFLATGKRTPHKGNDAGQPRLMNIETIEEAFDQNHGLAMGNSSMKVEEHNRFAEAGWELVSRAGWAQSSPRVGDQASILIVNRNHNAPSHVPWPGTETNPKVLCGLRTDSSFCKIGVMDVDALECKGERWVVLRTGR